MKAQLQQIIIIPDQLGGMRLDQALATLLPEYSRTQIQEWIKNKEITVNQHTPKARDRVIGGEEVYIQGTRKQQPIFEAQAIELDILFEDDELLVINKPAGMVVHPGAGNANNTLLNALIHHAPALSELPRAGIVHRLDKETTGLLVIAKTPETVQYLTRQIKARAVTRIYQAIVIGVMTGGGRVDEPIGRHPIQRKRMTVIETGKPSVTHYRVIERFRAHTHINVQLETGRTHQIRVHMAHIQYPILGDPVYAGRLQLPKGASPDLVSALRQFKRQALHASELSLIHPKTGKTLTWRAPLPEDMLNMIAILKEDQ
jgi:23S rRNA pseudouridine1911/1915/1917 synthase